jgi:hypothetical protein
MVGAVKAKVSEAPPILAEYETLSQSYFTEKIAIGTAANVGWTPPTSSNFTYTAAAAGIGIAAPTAAIGGGVTPGTDNMTVTFTIPGNVLTLARTATAGITKYVATSWLRAAAAL